MTNTTRQKQGSTPLWLLVIWLLAGCMLFMPKPDLLPATTSILPTPQSPSLTSTVFHPSSSPTHPPRPTAEPTFTHTPTPTPQVELPALPADLAHPPLGYQWAAWDARQMALQGELIIVCK